MSGKGIRARTLVLATAFLVLMVPASVGILSKDAFAVEPTWAKSYGGKNHDLGLAADLTADGGYVVAGQTNSFGSIDGWVLKLDPSGNVEWEKGYGADGHDENDALFSIKQTNDGGYITAGLTWSFGASNQAGDFWVLKLEADGDIDWEKRYGTGSTDFGFSVDETLDGGYVLTGFAGSGAWVIKVDSDGDVEWERGLGPNNEGHIIRQVSDGGYFVVGYTVVPGKDVEGWAAKLDADGKVEWEKSMGGTILDYFNDFRQTTEGGYILVGRTNSLGESNEHAWIVKMDSEGEIEWQKALEARGGYDEAFSVVQTADGGFVVGAQAGVSGSSNDDLWILKLESDGDIQWERSYGGASSEGTFQGNQQKLQVLQTPDGGYFAVAQTGSFGAGSLDLWALRLDSEGKLGGCSEGLVRNTNAEEIDADFESVDKLTVNLNTTDFSRNTATVVKDTNATVAESCATAQPCDNPTIEGTNGNDVIDGTPGADVINGKGGDDKINGLGGNDIICGSDGRDTISGGSGSDTIFGGKGNDSISGGMGNDILNGGDGNDTISGNGGNDKLIGSSGNDSLSGLDGTANNDSLDGGFGTDACNGNPDPEVNCES